jgi:hypothetical protein
LGILFILISYPVQFGNKRNKLMNINVIIRKTAVICIFALVLQIIPSCKQQKSEFAVLESELIRTLDSTRYYVEKLEKYIEVGKSRSAELEILKAENSKALIVENSLLLETFLDSLQHHAGEINDNKDFSLQVRTQMDYLHSLNASAKAILSGDSQNFGKWE